LRGWIVMIPFCTSQRSVSPGPRSSNFRISAGRTVEFPSEIFVLLVIYNNLSDACSLSKPLILINIRAGAFCSGGRVAGKPERNARSGIPICCQPIPHLPISPSEIALQGHRGPRVAESLENLPGSMPFFRTRETPLNRPVFSRLKRLFSENTSFYEIFCRASTPFPLELFLGRAGRTALRRRTDRKREYVPEGTMEQGFPSERGLI
jgi:hypothetical protein